MNEYEISTNFVEIVSGTNSEGSRAYREAAAQVEENDSKSLKYVKNFLTSIEEISSKDGTKDSRISGSKGNIKNFAGYDNIKKSLEFLKKHASGVKELGDIEKILNFLETNQQQYVDGYKNNIHLITLEYESAVYMIVTGLSLIMATSINIEEKNGKISVQKKSSETKGVLYKIIRDMAKELDSKKHKEYLVYLLESKERNGVNTDITESSTFVESAVGDTIALIGQIWDGGVAISKFAVKSVKSIKASLIGIVPLIRATLYLKYKKKADTISALEQQVRFIELNIQQLENRTNIDPKKKETIIRKQRAKIEEFKKKAEKLRAQLVETEKDAAVEIKKEDPKMSTAPEDDGDFVLENVSLSNDSGNSDDEYDCPLQ